MGKGSGVYDEEEKNNKKKSDLLVGTPVHAE
jgi:hypothetical protein